MGNRTCWYAGGSPGLGMSRGNSTPVGGPVEQEESPKEPEQSAKEYIEETLEALSERTQKKLISNKLLPILEGCHDETNIRRLLYLADFVLDPEVESSYILGSDLEQLAQTIRAGKDPTKDQLDKIGLESGLSAEIFVRRVINCVNEDRIKRLSRATKYSTASSSNKT